MTAKETRVVDAIQAYVKANGGFSFKLPPITPGLPDLIGGVHGIPFAVECKREVGNTTTLAQDLWLVRFAGGGYKSGCARNLNDFKKIIGVDI